MPLSQPFQRWDTPDLFPRLPLPGSTDILADTFRKNTIFRSPPLGTVSFGVSLRLFWSITSAFFLQVLHFAFTLDTSSLPLLRIPSLHTASHRSLAYHPPLFHLHDKETRSFSPKAKLFTMAGRYTTRSQTANTQVASELETVSWAKTHLQLPTIVLANGELNAKSRFFELTSQLVDASDISALNKCNLFLSRFTFSAVRGAAHDNLKGVHNLTGAAHPIVIYGPAFQFDDVTLRNTNGGELVLHNHAVLNANTRNNARILSFTVTVRPQAAFLGLQEDCDKAQFNSATFQAAVRLPLLNNALHPALDQPQLLDPAIACQIITNINGGNIPPPIGTFVQGGPQRFAEVKVKDFTAAFLDFYHECHFSLVKVLARKDFLGTAVLNTSMISRQLALCVQRGVDKATNVWADRSVTEYYGAYSAIVALFPMSDDFPLDICANFIINFAPDIADQMTDTQWVEPVRPPGESNSEGLQRLRSIKDAALILESSVKTITRLQNRSSNRNSWIHNRGTTHVPLPPRTSGGRATNSFALQPTGNTNLNAYNNANAFTFPCASDPPRNNAGYDDYGADDDTRGADGYDYSDHGGSGRYGDSGYGGGGHYIPPPSSFPLILNAADYNYEQCMMNVAIYTSVAEEALTNAQGSQARPLLECWGCTNLPRYHEQRHSHRFFQCPNKNDPAVQANGMRGYREFVDRKSAARSRTPYGPTRVMSAMSDWKADGYPSQGLAELIQDIARESTPASARRAFLGTLKAKSAPSAPEKKRAHNSDFQSPPDRSYTGYPVTVPDTSLAACIHFSNAVRDHRVEADVQISQLLPHSNFPIGSNGDATLLCMIDTGASLNLGRFGYHEDIFLTNPDLVHSFVYLKDIEGMKPLTIGGVGTEGPPAEVIAITTYKTDLFLNGKMVLLSIALSQTAAANTIVGLPLLKAFNATILLGSDTIVCQTIGAAFALSYVTPLRSDTAPTVCKAATRAFYTPSDTELDASARGYASICAKAQAMTCTERFALISNDDASRPGAQNDFDPWAEWYDDDCDDNDHVTIAESSFSPEQK